MASNRHPSWRRIVDSSDEEAIDREIKDIPIEVIAVKKRTVAGIGASSRRTDEEDFDPYETDCLLK